MILHLQNSFIYIRRIFWANNQLFLSLSSGHWLLSSKTLKGKLYCKFPTFSFSYFDLLSLFYILAWVWVSHFTKTISLFFFILFIASSFHLWIFVWCVISRRQRESCWEAFLSADFQTSAKMRGLIVFGFLISTIIVCVLSENDQSVRGGTIIIGKI